MTIPESTIQQQIISYLSLMASRYHFVFFSIPNEGIMTVLKMFKVPDKQCYMIVSYFKKMGLLPGVSDILILHQGKAYCMEVKDETGTQSQDQVRFEKNVNDTGIPYELVRSVEDAGWWLREWGIVA